MKFLMTKIIFFIIPMMVFKSDFLGVMLVLMMLVLFIFNSDLLTPMIICDYTGSLGGDVYSMFMLILVLFISGVIYNIYGNEFNWFLYVIMIISFILMFLSLDLMFFFLFFEFSIIPMFMFIMMYGYYEERYISAMYMFIYTMVSSLPMLWVVFLIYSQNFSLSMDYLGYNVVEYNDYLMMFMVMMFLVKVPMVFFHIWLPKAHVDAPVFGSMILASIMLKMGGYGVIRFMMMDLFSVWMNDLFIVFSLVGGLLLSVSCMWQVDQKVLVAYSSVIHMGMMLSGFFSELIEGWFGGLVMMISHGIISSAMFYFVDCMYKVSGSRLIMMMTGMYLLMPSLMSFWFIVLISNLGCPPFMSVYSEIFLISSLLSYNYFFFVYIFLLVFFVSCFVIKMYSGVLGGLFYMSKTGEGLVMFYGVFYHLFFMVLFSLYMMNLF